MWQQAQAWLKRKLHSTQPDSTQLDSTQRDSNRSGGRQPAAESEPVLNPCCNQDVVHIAFRGKADDRMYIAYNRSWSEVRFYQPNGLRVFCSKCRRRIL